MRDSFAQSTGADVNTSTCEKTEHPAAHWSICWITDSLRIIELDTYQKVKKWMHF